jgi:leucyl-tRNA synthetase
VWKYAEAQMANGKWQVAGAGESITPLIHKTIKKVTEDIENLHYNTSVSALMILLRAFEDNEPKAESRKPKADFETFLKLLAPFAPHITEEIWREMLGHETSIHREPWPSYDPALIKEESFTLVFQVNGKTRDTMQASADITEDEAKAAAFANEKIKAAIGTAQPKKTIYVEKRLVNIVI